MEDNNKISTSEDNQQNNRYGLNDEPKETKHDEIVKTLDETLKEFKTLDEENPLERARKYQIVKDNPPEPEYKKVSMGIYSKSITKDGKLKFIPEDVFFQIDPYMLYQSNIAAAPINAVSNLIELAKEQVREEKRILKHEKREKEFPWGWVIIGLSLVPAIVFFIFYFL